MVAAPHACCDGPRLNNCRCDDRDASRRESEPAQPFARVNADGTAVPMALATPPAAVPASRVAWLDASPPPAATRERLSLLSTLLV